MSKKLVYYVHVEDDQGTPHTFGPDDSVPVWAAKKITNPSAWAHGDDTASTPDPDPDEPDESEDPYKGLLKADLEAEVEKRNEDRDTDDEIAVGGTGKVADLLEALRADDAAQAEDEDSE